MYCPNCRKQHNRMIVMESKFAMNQIVVHQCPSCMNIECELLPTGEAYRQKVGVDRA